MQDMSNSIFLGEKKRKIFSKFPGVLKVKEWVNE